MMIVALAENFSDRLDPPAMIPMSAHLDKFLDETIDFWRRRMSREPSREDARQIVENVTGFFKILSEWEAANQPGGSDASGLGVVNSDQRCRRHC